MDHHEVPCSCLLALSTFRLSPFSTSMICDSVVQFKDIV